MIPTPQQLAVAQYVADATSSPAHCAVVARAGSGKTTTIVAAAQHYSEPGAAIAFNKMIATELERRLPENFLSRTINSICYRGYFELTKQSKPKLDTKKPYTLVKELNGWSFPDLAKAYNIAREWGIVPRGALASPKSVTEDTPETWNRLFLDYDIDVGQCEDPIGLARSALLLGIKYAWKGLIDFTDQKYMPVIYEAKLPKVGLVFVDEFQDTSPIDQAAARLLCAPSGRIIAVGDDRQAIYGFRGADRNAIPRFIDAMSAATLPLTVSFRCPRAVIKQAQTIVADIECGLELEGEVRFLDKLLLEELPQQSAFLCRNNKPLVALYFRMIKCGIPCTIRGREIGAGIAKMLLKTKRRTIAEALQSMWQDVEHQARLYIQRDQAERADLLQDKAECAQIIGSRIGLQSDVQAFKAECERLFSDETPNGRIVLSSVHKAKGLEWPNVFVLDPFLMPSKFAKTEESKLQESNLQYVAITRAQSVLSYINSSDIQ